MSGSARALHLTSVEAVLLTDQENYRFPALSKGSLTQLDRWTASGPPIGRLLSKLQRLDRFRLRSTYQAVGADSASQKESSPSFLSCDARGSTGVRYKSFVKEVNKMTKVEFYSLLIQSIVAIGSIVVSILAIWGDFIRSKIAPPLLRINLNSFEGDPTKSHDGRKFRFYHLCVKNNRIWSIANNVVVNINLLEKPGPDGEWQSAMYCGKIPLAWQFGEVYSSLPSIGKEHICDLGHIAEENKFKLKTRISPNNFDGSVDKNEKIRVHLQAVADNAKSNILILEIAWNGKWSSGSKEMAKNLIIKEIS